MRRAHVTPVAFLFQRKGAVRVAIQEGDDFDARLERLVDTALTAEAEDFEQDEPDEGSMEVEVMLQLLLRPYPSFNPDRISSFASLMLWRNSHLP